LKKYKYKRQIHQKRIIQQRGIKSEDNISQEVLGLLVINGELYTPYDDMSPTYPHNSSITLPSNTGGDTTTCSGFYINL
jgi:hypothetical protein